MCGIFGVIGNYYRGLENLDLKLLEHRGPDSRGVLEYKKTKLIFAHTRLSIIDVKKRSNQPMISTCKNFCITYNGEIYNFLNLKNHLISKGLSFKTNSDTEVILNGYKYYGISFFNKLNGIFSFAIFDKRNKLVHICRDPAGVKPLYFKKNNNGLIFSSEVKPIIYYLKLKNKINKKVLVNHLIYNFSPGSEIIFKGINKLLPGNIITFVDGKYVSTNQIKIKIKNKPKVNSIIDKFEKILDESIRSQTMSEKPIGSFLSGGLDSTTIVFFASKLKLNLDTFCVTGPWEKNEDKNTDLFYASKIAKILNVNLHKVNIDDKLFFENLKKVIFKLEEPIADPASFSTFFISKLAKKMGIKVLLSGIGGDEVFAGYRRHILAKYSFLLDIIPIQILAKLNQSFEKTYDRKLFGRRINRFLNVLDENKKINISNLLRWHSYEDIKNVLNSNVKVNFDDINLTKSNEFRNNLKSMLLIDKKYYLPEHNLNYTDKMSMSCGVEIRVPLIDNRITSFMDSIPNEYLIKVSETKWLLKKVMEKYLPKNFIYRKKVGFGLPIHDWISKSKYSFVFDNLTSNKFKKFEIFNQISVEKLIVKSKNGDEQASILLYAIQCIYFWLSCYMNENEFLSN